MTGPLRTLSDVEVATMAWVDWNHRRLRSSIGNVPPVEHEHEHENENEHYGHNSATRPGSLTT